MILKANAPIAYYCSNFDSVGRSQIQTFIKESKLYLAINLIALIVIVITAIWLFLAFQLLFGSVYLMTFSFPLLLAGTFVNWKRMNKAKEKLRG